MLIKSVAKWLFFGFSILAIQLLAGCGGGSSPEPNTKNGNLALTFAYPALNAGNNTEIYETINYAPTVYGMGNNAPTYSLVGGALPPGTIFDSHTGAISGAATAPGTYSVTVRLTVDGFSGSLEATTSFTIAAHSWYYPYLLSDLHRDSPFSSVPTHRVLLSGATYNFVLVSGNLPPGLNFETGTGKLSGTPNTAGTYTFGISNTTTFNNNTNTATQNFFVSVLPPGVALSYGSVSGKVGQSYSLTPSVTGTAPGDSLLFTLGTVATLPAGLVLNPSTGVISGTPTTAVSGNLTRVVLTDTRNSTTLQADSYVLMLISQN